MIFEKILAVAAIGFIVIFFVGPIITWLVCTIWEAIMDMKRNGTGVFRVWVITIITVALAFAATFFWYIPGKETSKYNDGYKEGHITGYDEGYEIGTLEGRIEGRNAGYDEGYDAGYSEGYNVGYGDGEKRGEIKSQLASSDGSGTAALTAPAGTNSDTWTPPADRWIPSWTDPDQTVYVSNRSHTIHSIPNCSGMKNYIEMTFWNAVEEGYDFCLNCW